MRQWVWVIAAALTTYAVFMAAAAASDRQRITVTVDLEANAGGYVELYVNDLISPFYQPLDLHQRKKYQFPIEADTITLVRLDPTDADAADVRVYGIEIAAGSKAIRRFAPSDLAGWVREGMEVTPTTEAHAFRTKGNDPLMYTAGTIDLPPPSVLQRLARVIAFERIVLAAYVGVPLLALLVSRRGERVVGVLVPTSALLLVPSLLVVAASLRFQPPDVGVAVSRAAFYGLSAGRGQAALLGALAVSTAIAIVLGMTVRRRNDHVSSPSEDTPATPTLWRWLLALPILAVFVAPDLQGILSSFATYVNVPQWDSDNLTYWAFLAARGDLPFRDFWYTYGGLYLFDLSWPVGPALRWIFEFALYAVFLTGLWMLAPQRRLGGAIGVFVLLVAARVGLTPLWYRYLIGIDVIVAYLVLAVAARIRPLHVCFAFVTMATGMVVELVQVLYAAPAVMAACVLDCISAPSWTWAACIRRLTAPLVLFASGVAVLILLAPVLVATGQLTGVIDFYLSLGEQVNVVTFPTSLDGLGWRLVDMRLATLWWPIVAVSLGVYLRVRARSSSERVSGLWLLAIGVLAFVILQKHVIRPIEMQHWLYPLATVVVQAAILPSSLPLPGRLVLGALAGMFIASVAAQGQTSSVIDLIVGGPRRAIGSISLLFDPVRNSLANGERFAPLRFRDHVRERELIDGLQARLGSTPALFSLTDSPILYLLTGQPAVWLSNMYNASSVREQMRIVRWLESGAVDYVVFERSRLHIDGVPLPVRVPMVVKAVIELFTPDSHVGGYEVLRRRAPTEPVDLATWAKWLGSTLDLGHLPSLIEIDDRSACTLPSCDQYIVVNVDKPDPNQAGNVALTLDGVPFELTFAVTATRTRYVIPLSRLWFWRAPLEPETAGVRANGGRDEWVVTSLARDATRLY